MRAACTAVVVTVALVAVAARAQRQADDRGPAYRLGAAASRVAILPVKCARDMDTALCSTIDESLGVDLARDPRIDVVTARDLEVLLGAQQIVEMASCEGEDTCFDASAFTQIEASYLLSVSIGRIGGDAMITVRLVDLKRGVVIDRDDARAWRGSEAAIDEATRALARTILVRRGVGTPPRPEGEDDGGSPLAFWGGVGVGSVGVVGVAAGGVLGTLSFIEATALKRSTGLTQPNFDAGAQSATELAFGADVALIAGGALVVGGATKMILGSF
jgi:hypothetical protein